MLKKMEVLVPMLPLLLFMALMLGMCSCNLSDEQAIALRADVARLDNTIDSLSVQINTLTYNLHVAEREITYLNDRLDAIQGQNYTDMSGYKKLTWDSPEDSFKVYIGSESGRYDLFYWTDTTHFVLPLRYVAVTAVNEAGESGYSQEVVW